MVKKKTGASRASTLITLLLMITFINVSSAAPASALVPKTHCDRKFKAVLVYTYTRPSNQHKYPLRCGTSAWGFQHIKTRWSPEFESLISTTIKYGQIVNDVQQDGGTHIFALNNRRCINLFRVIYSTAPDQTRLIFPIGLISAYYWDGAGVALIEPTSITSSETSSSSNWRTDCKVIQRV